MPNLTMTVKYVNPPKQGKQRGSIKGTDDQILGVFADKMHTFEPGQTYDIEYTETASNGVTYRNVKSATRIETAAAAASSMPAQSNNTYRETSPVDGKRMFVCANLTALIRAGKVENDKASLWATTQLLANLWEHTFGEASTFRATRHSAQQEAEFMAAKHRSRRRSRRASASCPLARRPSGGPTFGFRDDPE
jgi:hypothetical protein